MIYDFKSWWLKYFDDLSFGHYLNLVVAVGVYDNIEICVFYSLFLSFFVILQYLSLSIVFFINRPEIAIYIVGNEKKVEEKSMGES